MEAPEKCPCLAACASVWRQPSLFGDDTRAVVTRPKERESADYALVWSLVSVVEGLAHVHVLEDGRGQK